MPPKGLNTNSTEKCHSPATKINEMAHFCCLNTLVYLFHMSLLYKIYTVAIISVFRVPRSTLCNTRVSTTAKRLPVPPNIKKILENYIEFDGCRQPEIWG